MSKTLYPRVLAGMLLISSLVACGIPLAQTPQPETETPIPTVSPTEIKTATPTTGPSETITPVSSATVHVAPVTSTPKFAPFCEPSSASVATPIVCQVPIAEQSSSFCSRKTPYNLILINEGSTYETLSEDVTCSDAGMKNGKQMLTCTGPMVTPFELKVCDPSCSLPKFQTGITHCPQNYTYNDFFGCCEQKPHPADANCVVLNLQTRSCVIECNEFINQKTCDQNAYACVWDRENNVCLLKK